MKVTSYLKSTHFCSFVVQCVYVSIELNTFAQEGFVQIV